jgi:hypothetical protein
VIFFIAYYRVFVFEFPLQGLTEKRPKTQEEKPVMGGGGGGGLDARPRTKTSITFLSSPYREALNQRNKKSRKKKKYKNLPGKKYIYPTISFETRSFVFSCFRTPLPRNAQNAPLFFKLRTYVLFFASWRRCTSVFGEFFLPPLDMLELGLNFLCGADPCTLVPNGSR